MSNALNIKLTKASAGSGKTFSLMNKIADLVNEKTDPASILATTFTVKAANELKERIRGKLLEMGKEDLAQKVSTGLIGTVNGICGRLLSEYAIEAGLSPQLDVLTDSNSRVIFQRAVAGAIKYDIVALEPLAFRMGMLEEQCFGFDEGKDWWSALIKMCDIARANGLDDRGLDASEARSLEAIDDLYPGTDSFPLSAVLGIVESQMPLIEKIADEESEERSIANEGVVKFCDRIMAFRREMTWGNAMPGGSAPGCKPRAKGEFGDIFKPLYEELKTKVYHSRELREDARNLVRALFKMVKSCLKAYQDFKKRYGLIDFVDQEMRLLELFEKNEGFKVAFKDRIKVIMVDEFQDTSPMQLALFLKMNELVGNSIWVGDPKQAIYGFRGTDPALMASVADGIKSANPENVDSLKYSWRSREKLVDFSNAIFGESFKETMDGQDIVLGIDWDQVRSNGQEESRRGGEIESWVINQKSDPKKGYCSLLAETIKGYIVSHKDIPLRKIAVLTRTNNSAGQIATALTSIGIPASASSGRLNTQPICNLVMAAYRYAMDKKDTIALATLVAYVMDDKEWFSHLVDGRYEETNEDGWTYVKNKTLDDWSRDERIAVLDVKETRTPLELLDFVIGAFSLDDYAGRMPQPERALRNLEALRSLCTAFMTEAKLGGYPVTHAGFVDYYLASVAAEASCIGGDCVQVMTYHKSKGLEWPVVILTELQKDANPKLFGLMVEGPEKFDATKPLAGRELRAVFNAFGSSEGMFKDSNEYKRVMPSSTLRDLEERKRLMYVGVTRARDALILAPQLNARKTKEDVVDAKWLDSLSETETSVKAKFAALSMNGKKVVKAPTTPSMFAANWKLTNDDRSDWTIAGKTFSVKSRYINPIPEENENDDVNQESKVQEAAVEATCWCDDECNNHPIQMPATRQPSAEEGRAVPVELKDVVEIGNWFSVEKSDEESAALGEAMHCYYAVAVPSGDDAELATELLARWNVEKLLGADLLVKSGANLRNYINTNWPNAAISTEVPMTYRDENGTCYQGFIDMLLEVDDGYVLIDHKTGASSAYQSVAEKYAGQQLIYKKAIEKATGKKVLKTILHLPVRGVCVVFDLP